jgi:hypothetical protein
MDCYVKSGGQHRKSSYGSDRTDSYNTIDTDYANKNQKTNNTAYLIHSVRDRLARTAVGVRVLNPEVGE